MPRKKKVPPSGRFRRWFALARRWTLALAALAVLGYAGLDLTDYLLRSDLFLIQDVEVEGSCLVNEDDILAKLDIPAVVHLWQIEPEILEARLMDIPEIRGVQVRRVLPQSLVVTVEERAPIADWRDPKSGKRYVLDEEAVIITEAERADSGGAGGNRPEILGLEGSGWSPGDRIDRDDLAEVLKSLSLALARGEEWAEKLSEIRFYRDGHGWVLRCQGFPPEFVLGDWRFVERIGLIDPVWKFLHRETIEAAYVDLRFDKQGVLVKPVNCDAQRWMEVARRHPDPDLLDHLEGKSEGWTLPGVRG